MPSDNGDHLELHDLLARDLSPCPDVDGRLCCTARMFQSAFPGAGRPPERAGRCIPIEIADGPAGADVILEGRSLEHLLRLNRDRVLADSLATARESRDWDLYSWVVAAVLVGRGR